MKKYLYSLVTIDESDTYEEGLLQTLFTSDTEDIHQALLEGLAKAFEGNILEPEDWVECLCYWELIKSNPDTLDVLETIHKNTSSR